MAVFIANVGANSSHAARGLESPLNADGGFALMPIPERQPWAPPMLRFQDLAHLAPLAPGRWLDAAVHYDPDLTSPIRTYGDNCSTAGRAYSLRRSQPGDLILFLARLRATDQSPCFALVGRLGVADVAGPLHGDPGPGWWDGNAHVRRARAGGGWNGFWVFRGGPGSGPFERAVRFDRAVADSAFGATWAWPAERTELQTIGSHTRAVRRLTGPGERYLRRLAG